MIYTTQPRDFKSSFDVVSCFCVKDNKLLLLHRQDHKPQGNLWGFPAGKVDGEEKYPNAMQRELKEETGLDVPLDKLIYINKVYTRYPEYDFTFHMYTTQVAQDAQIVLNPNEHKAYKWVDPKDIQTLPLMQDLEACLEFYSDETKLVD